MARRCRAGPRTRCGLVRGALSLSHECAMTIAARKRDSNTRRGARVHDEPERRSSARGTMRRGAQNKCCNGLVHDLFFLSIPATVPTFLTHTRENIVEPAEGSHTAILKPKFSSRARRCNGMLSISSAKSSRSHQQAEGLPLRSLSLWHYYLHFWARPLLQRACSRQRSSELQHGRRAGCV